MNTFSGLREAISIQSDFNDLRGICISLIRQGNSPDMIIEHLENIRSCSSIDDEYEDTILDLMDILSGWCSSRHSLRTLVPQQ